MTNSISRRRFLAYSSATLGIMLTNRSPNSYISAENAKNKPDQRYLNLKSDDYLSDVKIETTIKDTKIFTEGPAVDRTGHVFFTNVRASKILKWDPKKKSLSVFRDKSNASNGLLFDPEGNLIACEGGAGRLTRTNMKTGKVDVLIDSYRDFPLAPPNDLTMDDQGRIYFSSRPGVTDPSKGNVNAVYRLDPDGKQTQLLAYPHIHMPNGIVTSPDSKKLYLIEADGGKNRHRDIRVYDFQKQGTLKNEQVLYNFSPGRSGDGMCIDEQGNLYVAAGLHNRRGTSETLDTRPGIHVISPEGKLLAYARTPIDTITNCTFGGDDLKTLYITCGKYLLSLRTNIAGHRMKRQEM